ITLTEAGGHGVLTVRDDGPGIPAEHRERVFDRFVRLDDDRAREDDGGSGLGLAIAAEIARTHGGTLRVAESTSGACLELRLPLA
ncbi:ATP-binding protein, partial [Amycolatopsis mediterranei]